MDVRPALAGAGASQDARGDTRHTASCEARCCLPSQGGGGMPCPLRPFLATVAPRALGSHCQAPAVPPVSGGAPRWPWAEAGLQLWVLGLVWSGLAGQSSWEPRAGCRPGPWGRWAWCAVFKRCCRLLELSLEPGGRPAGGWTLRPGWAALGATPEALASSGSSSAGGAGSTGGGFKQATPRL